MELLFLYPQNRAKLILSNAKPFILETARLLATLTHPNHLVQLSSWGGAPLPPYCNSNDFGYIPFTIETAVLLATLTHPNHLVQLSSGG
jgi:hypothetical protein